MKAAKVERFSLLGDVPASLLAGITCRPSLAVERGYGFSVPLLDGDHVTDDAGTGFVHTAPGHGREDFDVWMTTGRTSPSAASRRHPLHGRRRRPLHHRRAGLRGKTQVITDKGEKGDANDAVIEALREAGNLVARGRLKHQYPHSWRSKKPVIFRNTPQWFIHGQGRSTAGQPTRCATVALRRHRRDRWVPAAGENRINGMIANRPDWVVSRQRAWGVPITVFFKESKEILSRREGQRRHRRGLRGRRAPTPGSPTPTASAS
jgi:isoleucyl-tRNA synthetase